MPLKLIKLSYLEEKDTLTGSFFTSLSLSLRDVVIRVYRVTMRRTIWRLVSLAVKNTMRRHRRKRTTGAKNRGVQGAREEREERGR